MCFYKSFKCLFKHKMTSRNNNIVIKKSDADKLKGFEYIKIQNSLGQTSSNLKIINMTNTQYYILEYDVILNDYTNKLLLVKENSHLNILKDRTFYISIPGGNIPQYTKDSYDRYSFRMLTSSNVYNMEVKTFKISATFFGVGGFWFSDENNNWTIFNELQQLIELRKDVKVYIKEYNATLSKIDFDWSLYSDKFKKYRKFLWYFINQGTIANNFNFGKMFDKNPPNETTITFQYAVYDSIKTTTPDLGLFEYYNSNQIHGNKYTCMPYICTSLSSNNNIRIIGCDWLPRLPKAITESTISYFETDIPFIDVPPLVKESQGYTTIQYDKPFNVPPGLTTITPYIKAPMPDLEPTGTIALQDGRKGVYCSFWGLEETQKTAKTLRSAVEYSASNIDDLYTKLVGI